MKEPIICWFSGGVTSAVACSLAIDKYGKDNCRCVFIDTKNEDDDSYRFLKDCEKWYGKEKASKVTQAEAFEICEYGRRPSDEEIRKLFPMISE